MKRILLSLSLLLLCSSLFSQEEVEHRVKWYETISTIAAKYGVEAQAILDYNNVKEEDVKSRMILRIPLAGAVAAAVDSLPVQGVTESAEEQQKEDSIIVYSADNPLKVSLVLPFGAAGETPSVNYLDFYSGALTALKKAKEEGWPVTVSVFDSRRPVDEILADAGLQASDVIVGPAKSTELKAFADFGLENGITVVSPMDQTAESLIEGNPYLFQVPSSANQQTFNMISSLNAGPDDQILVFFDSSMKEKNYVNKITGLLDSAGIFYRKIGYGILSGRDFSENLQKELNPEKTYKIIAASEDDAFAPDIVRNARVLKLFGISVELWCSNRVRNFESIDSDSFYELSTHVCAPYYIDYGTLAVKDFVLQYRALYNAEPTPYSFQGYDILSYFIKGFCQNGSLFRTTASEYPADMLQCSFSFKRDSEKSGWRNIATRNLIYNEDYTISTVK